jgi:hypothetical protein
LDKTTIIRISAPVRLSGLCGEVIDERIERGTTIDFRGDETGFR